jgi:hypothetical protein
MGAFSHRLDPERTSATIINQRNLRVDARGPH